jgi:hypothetical protein
MQLVQAYRVVLSVALLAGAAAQAQDGSPSEVLLAPGKSVRIFDAGNPGINVAVTAPEDAYLNLSRLIAASEKVGIFAVVTGIQIRSAGRIVSNADGSLSLQPAADETYFVPRNAELGPRRITIEGGTAIFDRGRTVFQSDTIVRPAGASAPVPVPGSRNEQPLLPATARPAVGAAAPASPVAPVQTVPNPGAIAVPTGGAVVSTGGAAALNVTATPAAGNMTNFSIGSSPGVTVTQSAGGVTLNAVPGSTLNIGGNMSATGNLVINNPGGTINVAPGTVMPSGNITFNTAQPMTSGAFVSNSASVPSSGISIGGGAITTTGSAKPPAAPVVGPR